MFFSSHKHDSFLFLLWLLPVWERAEEEEEEEEELYCKWAIIQLGQSLSLYLSLTAAFSVRLPLTRCSFFSLYGTLEIVFNYSTPLFISRCLLLVCSLWFTPLEKDFASPCSLGSWSRPRPAQGSALFVYCAFMQFESLLELCYCSEAAGQGCSRFATYRWLPFATCRSPMRSLLLSNGEEFWLQTLNLSVSSNPKSMNCLHTITMRPHTDGGKNLAVL